MVKESFQEAVRRHGLGYVAREAANEDVFPNRIGALHQTPREFLEEHHAKHTYAEDHPVENRLHEMHKRESNRHLWSLLKAAAEGNEAKVQKLVSHPECDIWGQSHGDCYTALHCAAGFHPQRGGHRCHDGVIRILLEAGGERLARMQTEGGHTALHCVAVKGTYKAVETLVRFGGQRLVAMKCNSGETAADLGRRGRDFRHPGPAGGKPVTALLADPDRCEELYHENMERVLTDDAERVARQLRDDIGDLDADGDGEITEQEWEEWMHKI